MNYQDLQINTLEEDREVNIASLCGHIIFKWRAILLIGLFFGLLGAAFQWYRSQKNEEQYEKSYTEYHRQLSNYESAIATYEKERNAVQTDITDIYSYIDQSILVKIDPYQEAYATADVLFDVQEDNYSLGVDQ